MKIWFVVFLIFNQLTTNDQLGCRLSHNEDPAVMPETEASKAMVDTTPHGPRPRRHKNASFTMTSLSVPDLGGVYMRMSRLLHVIF